MYGRDQGEHNRRFTAALKRIQAAGVTLNFDKCDFGEKPVSSFLAMSTKLAFMLIQTRPR